MLPEKYFVIEGGLYAYYEYDGVADVLIYRARQIAVAYDTHTLRFEMLGAPEEVMAWAAKERKHLRSKGDLQTAGNLVVSHLPRDVEPREYNRLLVEPSYFVYFLQKLGLV